jgi:hypothetical protein
MNTVDGHQLVKNMKVWEIGAGKVDGRDAYTPTLSIYGKDLANKERCWKDFHLCQAECDKLNNGN